MSVLTTSTALLYSDIKSTIVSLLICYVVYKLSKLYYLVTTLPPGPLPLPIVGNLLEFRGTKEHWSIELQAICKKFGPVMTLWMGTEPRIIISDIDMAREAFRRPEFAGRPSNIITRLFSNEKHKDVVLCDYGPTWESLRRVVHSAVQSYAATQKLNDLVIDCVDHALDVMVQKEGLDKPFVPFEYVHNIFLNILAASAFGKRYEFDDPEYKRIKYIQADLFQEANLNIFLWELIQFYRNLDPRYAKFVHIFEDFVELLKSKYQDHYLDYNEAVIRDFCDTLIAAKNEALREGKESAPYLTDDNLAMAVFDLFFAGTDTSQITFKWLLLHMTHNKKIELKLRHEIESEIGDRMPTLEDRNRCHYTMAFIAEGLRHSNSVPLGVQHKTVVTSKLGNYTIPQDTEILLFQGHILRQEQHWPDPDEFRPERFLENGRYIATKAKAFIPFGVGRRVCLGDRLAIADLFLVLVRFLQKTTDYELILHMEVQRPLNPDPNNMRDYHPKHHELSLRAK